MTERITRKSGQLWGQIFIRYKQILLPHPSNTAAQIIHRCNQRIHRAEQGSHHANVGSIERNMFFLYDEAALLTFCRCCYILTDSWWWILCSPTTGQLNNIADSFSVLIEKRNGVRFPTSRSLWYLRREGKADTLNCWWTSAVAGCLFCSQDRVHTAGVGAFILPKGHGPSCCCQTAWSLLYTTNHN